MQGKGKQRKAIESRMRNRITQKKMPRTRRAAKQEKAREASFPSCLSWLSSLLLLISSASRGSLRSPRSTRRRRKSTQHHIATPHQTTPPHQHNNTTKLPKTFQNEVKIDENLMRKRWKTKLAFQKRFLSLCLDF